MDTRSIKFDEDSTPFLEAIMQRYLCDFVDGCKKICTCQNSYGILSIHRNPRFLIYREQEKCRLARYYESFGEDWREIGT